LDRVQPLASPPDLVPCGTGRSRKSSRADPGLVSRARLLREARAGGRRCEPDYTLLSLAVIFTISGKYRSAQNHCRSGRRHALVARPRIWIIAFWRYINISARNANSFWVAFYSLAAGLIESVAIDTLLPRAECSPEVGARASKSCGAPLRREIG